MKKEFASTVYMQSSVKKVGLFVCEEGSPVIVYETYHNRLGKSELTAVAHTVKSESLSASNLPM